MNKRFLQNIEKIRTVECDGKTPHTSEVARKIVSKSHKGMRAYRCKCCGAWHVASSTQRGLPKLR